MGESAADPQAVRHVGQMCSGWGHCGVARARPLMSHVPGQLNKATALVSSQTIDLAPVVLYKSDINHSFLLECLQLKHATC